VHQRWTILTTLTTWIVASSYCALHTHGGNCRHDATAAHSPPVHAVCPHGHHHNHTDESESLPSWSARCVVCELLALSIVVPTLAVLKTAEFQIATNSLLDAQQPVAPLQCNWQGRAPPLSFQLT